MSNLIFVCWRKPEDAVPESTMRAVAERLAPSWMEGFDPEVAYGPLECACLTGPTGMATIAGTSVKVGAFSGPAHSWDRPGSPLPDGTFALVRVDRGRVELCSDEGASRTLWYALTDRRLFASTSQRALVALMESFDLNPRAFGWFLSSGNLGLSESWDRRIARLPRGSCLSLDRLAWSSEVRTREVAFRPADMDPREARQELLRTLRDTFRGYDFSSPRWLLPLSGGFDSRFILRMLLENGVEPRTATWGLAGSPGEPGNDAHVARRLAQRFGLRHDYHIIDPSGNPPERVVDRFLRASGGTTDEMAPYLDALELWSAFPRQGSGGIIRGDEGFGYIPLRGERHARSAVGMVLLKDFLSPEVSEAIGCGSQWIPEHLHRQPDESIPTYRDRLYHAYDIPVDIAALNDVKSPFVEIASPLLSRGILELVRRMPDSLRTDKALFRTLAEPSDIQIPYATMGAIDDRNDFLQSGAYRQWMVSELEASGHRLLPEPFLQDLLELLRTRSGATSHRTLRSTLKHILPRRLLQAFRSVTGPRWPTPLTLAFRTALACRMLSIYREDADSVGSC